MKDFKDLDELRQAVNEWANSNPLIEDFTVNGVTPALSFNSIITIDLEKNAEIEVLSASRACNITEKELVLHNFNHIDTIVRYTKEHINSVN